MDEKSVKLSPLKSATVLAAAIGCISAVLSAVLPWWLGRQEPAVPAASVPVASALAPITPLAASAVRRSPNLTLGVWTIINSIDDNGTDFSGSTLKFTTQRETPDGLELVGFFEWRKNNNVIIGQEYFVANFEEASRQLFIEGQYVKPADQLAVGSFSARLSDDGRQLIEGTWGNTPNNLAGVPGRWEARR